MHRAGGKPDMNVRANRKMTAAYLSVTNINTLLEKELAENPHFLFYNQSQISSQILHNSKSEKSFLIIKEKIVHLI